MRRPRARRSERSRRSGRSSSGSLRRRRDNVFDLGASSLSPCASRAGCVNAAGISTFPFATSSSTRRARELARAPRSGDAPERGSWRRAAVGRTHGKADGRARAHRHRRHGGPVSRRAGRWTRSGANLRDGRRVDPLFRTTSSRPRRPAACARSALREGRGIARRRRPVRRRLLRLRRAKRELIDPQQRMFLECAWEALERRGLRPEAYDGGDRRLRRRRTTTRISQNVARTRPDLVASGRRVPGDARQREGSPGDARLVQAEPARARRSTCRPRARRRSSPSTRRAAACVDGECDMALAGGVVHRRCPTAAATSIRRAASRRPTATPRVRRAGARARSSATASASSCSSGLADAVADGDTIHAVIRGTAINNDGAAKVGYTAPSVEGQAAVDRDGAGGRGRRRRPTISYVEAHGTGTPLGDPIEVAALTQAFRRRRPTTGSARSARSRATSAISMRRRRRRPDQDGAGARARRDAAEPALRARRTRRSISAAARSS